LHAIIALQNRIVQAGLDTDAVRRTVVAQLSTLIPSASGAVVELLDGEQMVYSAASGALERFVGLRLDPGSSLSGLCVKERKPLYAQDTETDPRVDLNACRVVGIRSMICCPLLAQDGECVGVCKAGAKEPEAFTDTDVAVLAMLASVIASSIKHAGSFQDAVLTGRIDPLTGLGNRRSYDEEIVRAVARARRSGDPLCMALIDLDKFKEFNDTYGHERGDEMLRTFSEVLKSVVRADDRIFRFGGDEFCLLLPNADADDAAALIARIESALERVEVDGVPIVFSCGVAQLKNGDEGADLLRRADARMYQHKRRFSVR
jgi:diguanylate cyclase (GGDEF)-like protein